MATNGAKRKRHPWHRCVSFPYEVKYNDHFETPLSAYRDIQPLLDWIALPSTSPGTQKKRSKKHNERRRLNDDRRDSGGTVIRLDKQPRLYDPYYCDGSTQRQLQSLGYNNIIHEKRDFYKDIASGTVPEYDVLITNPPYSEQHKISCLDFCMKEMLQRNRTFFVLMPSYVPAKQYYRKLLLQDHQCQDAVVYMVPNEEYRYDHPEGTGKANCPFASLWLCGIGRERYKLVQEFWQKQAVHRDSPKLYMTLEELQRCQVITTKRPNPRQRRAKKKRMMSAGSMGISAAKAGPAAPGNRENQWKEERSQKREHSGKCYL